MGHLISFFMKKLIVCSFNFYLYNNLRILEFYEFVMNSIVIHRDEPLPFRQLRNTENSLKGLLSIAF